MTFPYDSGQDDDTTPYANLPPAPHDRPPPTTLFLEDGGNPNFPASFFLALSRFGSFLFSCGDHRGRRKADGAEGRKAGGVRGPVPREEQGVLRVHHRTQRQLLLQRMPTFFFQPTTHCRQSHPRPSCVFLHAVRLPLPARPLRVFSLPYVHVCSLVRANV